MRVVHAGWILLAIPALCLPAGAELGYRMLAQKKVGFLRKDVLSAHPEGARWDFEFTRFGSDVREFEVSLFQDLIEGLRDRGGESRLDFAWPDDDLKHGYASINISFAEERKEQYHVFIWSPGRLGFVPLDGYGGCSRPACPYSLLPEHPSR